MDDAQLLLDFEDVAPRREADTPRTAAAAPLRRPIPPQHEAMAMADCLRTALEAKSGLRIHLKITDNRSTVMSVRYDQGGRAAKVACTTCFSARILYSWRRWRIGCAILAPAATLPT